MAEPYEWPGGFREGDLVTAPGRGRVGEVAGAEDLPRVGPIPEHGVAVRLDGAGALRWIPPAELVLLVRREQCGFCGETGSVYHATIPWGRIVPNVPACARCRREAASVRSLLEGGRGD